MGKIIISALILIMAVFLAGCQTDTFCQEFPALDDIQESQIRSDLDSLTSPLMQGRAAGLKGGQRAGDFILQRLRQAQVLPLSEVAESGLLEDSYQKFRISGVSPSEIQIAVSFKKGGNVLQAINGEDIYYFYNSTHRLEFSGEIIFAGYAISAPEYQYDDFFGIDIAGKIVLAYYGEPLEKDSLVFFNGTSQTHHLMENWKAKTVAEKGGKALILIPTPQNKDSYEKFIQRRTAYRDRRNFVLKDDTVVPVLYLSPEFTRQLLEEHWEVNFQRGTGLIRNALKVKQNRPLSWIRKEIEPLPLQLKLDHQSPEIRECRNILAVLPGSDPQLRNEYILIGAHYDHEGVRDGKLYPGADDNASGVVSNLNIAAAFAGLPADERPSRSLIFAFWDGEELGTLGSRYFLNHPPVPLSQIRIAFNMDMIGRDASFNFAALRQPMVEDGAGNKVMIFYSAQAPALESLAVAANERVNLQLLFDPNVYFTSGSDHLHFHGLQIPILWYFTGFHTDYTSPDDTADKINFDKLTRISRHIAALAYSLAGSQNIPVFDASILTAPPGDFTR